MLHNYIRKIDFDDLRIGEQLEDAHETQEKHGFENDDIESNMVLTMKQLNNIPALTDAIMDRLPSCELAWNMDEKI